MVENTYLRMIDPRGGTRNVPRSNDAPRTCESSHSNPMKVLDPGKLEAFNFLQHPIWIFDFVQGRNRWANTAGLRLWEAPNLEEFVGRYVMSQMSPDVEARTRNTYRQVEQGHSVDERWTIFPPYNHNGNKGKTVQLSATGLRLKAEENHCCILCIASPLENQPRIRSKELFNGSFSMGVAPSSLLPLSKISLCEEYKTDVNALMKDNDERLRARAMVHALPLSVCLFDMNGKFVFENSASILRHPPRSPEEEKEKEDDASSHELERNPRRIDDIIAEALSPDDNPVTQDDTDDDEEEKSEDSTSNSSSCNKASRSDFTDRFLNAEVAQAALRTMQAQDRFDMKTELYTAHGPRWSSIELRKMKDPVTRKPLILFISQDKADTDEAKRHCEASVRNSEFLATIAHAIRTPLHQVTVLSDLLRMTSLTSEQMNYAKILKSISEGLMSDISASMDCRKLEAGQITLQRVPFEPLSVLNSSMAAVRSSCEDKDLYLKMTWDKRIPSRIMGDPNRLQQILLNLLSNAIKFTSRGGIQVDALFIDVLQGGENATSSRSNSGYAPTNCTRSTSTRSWIKFVVADSGCGIPKKYQKTMFEQYQQGSLSSSGKGLGLSLCQLLVKSMNGSIGVDSHVGHGSSFWAALPIDHLEEHHARLNESESKLEEFDTLNILLAEDNRINQKIMAKIFQQFGCHVTIAENGQEAIEMVEKGHYDAIFMDIQMPVVDGLEATRYLRSKGYKDLPIYGLTANAKQSDYAELGFDDWLQKPIPANDLKNKLHQLLKSKRGAVE